ncbi:MAG TPA: MerR family transcriptional regulator [Bacillus sp. (in: firmicutes)]|nr:MerR family transcriptional regulator [Bacillus sp. (in: firmicutes)]
MTGLTISQVAMESNVNITTVRYYEKRGLISQPPRTQTGYRMYSNEAIEDIKFIKKAQDLGFNLKEIKKLLSIYKKEEYFPTEEMYQFSIAKYKEIDEKIKQLSQFKSLLELVIKLPPSDLHTSKSQCPIIKKLTEGENKNG